MSNKSLVSRSVRFYSDRGNDTYLGNQQIRIKINPATAPLISPIETFLKFNLTIPSSNNCRYVPNPKCSMPFSRITIYDGTESTVLEQIDDVNRLQALLSWYSDNQNSHNLKGVFEGRILDNRHKGLEWVNPETYIQCPKVPVASALNQNGGMTTPYFDCVDGSTAFDERPVEMIYRFNLSGILGDKAEQIVPCIAMNGLVIRLELLDPKKFLVPLSLDVGEPSQLGYGKIAKNSSSGALEQGLNENYTCYEIKHWVVGGVDTAPLADGDAFTAIELKNAADGVSGNNVVCDTTNGAGIKNFVGCVGSQVLFSNDAAGTDAGFGEANLFNTTNRITKIEVNSDRVKLTISGTNNSIERAAGSRLAVYIQTSDSTAPKYEVDNVELIASVVQTDSEYLGALMSKAQGGGLDFQYNTYQNYKINIPANNTQNELYLPATQRRAWSLISQPEILLNDNTERVNGGYKQDISNLREYQLTIGDIAIPQLPVDLERLNSSKPAPLQQIELHKALIENEVDLRNLVGTWNAFAIGRGFGRYGSSMNLNDTSLRLRLNFAEQPHSLLQHNWIYHRRTLKISPNGRMVEI